MNDEYYMKLALQLAAKGRGYVSPNPMVGAVIVKNGRKSSAGVIISAIGGNHAEINAIKNADRGCCRINSLCYFGTMLP